MKFKISKKYSVNLSEENSFKISKNKIKIFFILFEFIKKVNLFSIISTI